MIGIGTVVHRVRSNGVDPQLLKLLYVALELFNVEQWIGDL